MTSADPMAEIRASFFVECEELLEALQDGLQALDDGRHDEETIHVVFRAVHSIKGGAGAFGFEALVQFAHQFETALDSIRAGKARTTPGLLDVFFRASDHLSDLVRACRNDLDHPKSEAEAILRELNVQVSQASQEKDANDNECEPVEIESSDAVIGEDPSKHYVEYNIFFEPEPGFFETGHEVSDVINRLATLGEIKVQCDSSRLPALDQLIPDKTYLSWSLVLTTDVDEAGVASHLEFAHGLCRMKISVRSQCQETGSGTTIRPRTDDQRTASPTPSKSVVRVDIDRVERLANLVGELVINQSMLAQSLQTAGVSPHSDAMYGLEEFQRLTRDIQDSVMMIRAQPVKSLFQRMARIVREASASVSKDVRLVTVGEATEVDKTVIEQLVEPLTHMIRNAVDHGLEPSDVRLAHNKPARGEIRLSAAHRSGRVLIQISDDGQGIDRDKVLRTAVEKGLVAEDVAMTDAEIDTLLFLPGFSTAPDVSDLSGRGVGMDVVRTAIHRLGGRVTIGSTPNAGTTFSISLPLTLAVLDGMVIDVAGETLVLPLNTVSETLTLSDSLLEQIQPGHFVVRVRDGFVPLFDLGAALGYRPPCDTVNDRIAMLLMLEDESQVALLVDEVHDQRQVVIKGLDDSCCRPPGIAAATILGDGQVALILDPADIVTNTIKSPAPKRARLEPQT
ncbi:chemotaxis protein CheA [uncultured Tateyamaria sp.]|uniref:chemotaxis protein CheA n=1 Tax=uncultured Tateyamaria sp. TaxID=455651 RepID=UPI00262F3EE4|nr:chemotaxis protein CheA [uncultured Tateyamaria sp.]